MSETVHVTWFAPQRPVEGQTVFVKPAQIAAAAVIVAALTGCQDAPVRPPSAPTAAVPTAVQR